MFYMMVCLTQKGDILLMRYLAFNGGCDQRRSQQVLAFDFCFLLQALEKSDTHGWATSPV
jgi:hypothetical protein